MERQLTEVFPSVQALIHGIIDYAGLFPPAKLGMEDTVRNYAAYHDDADAWMLNRLIIPIARLEEFELHAADLLPHEENAEPWPISGLTAQAGDDNLSKHLEIITAFNSKHTDPEHGLAIIDTIELKGSSLDAIEHTLDLLPDEVFPFFEIPLASDCRGMIAALVGSDAGAKIRTGGVTADLYPSSETVARFIVACARAGVSFKATAGLHHPLRHYSEAVTTNEHGFLNVFAAATFAHTYDWDEDAIRTLLEDEDASSFAFAPDQLTYHDTTVSTEEIEHTRNLIAISFGSCSFDEPREDLRALNLR